MKTPTIHMNGSSAEVLLDAYMNASTAVYGAMEELAKCTPNARDYYTQGNSAFTVAQEEHNERMRRLYDVRKELNELAEYCSDAVVARTR